MRDLQTVVLRSIIGVFAVFLSCGNLLRIFPSVGSHSLVATEGLLYLLVVVFLGVIPLSAKSYSLLLVALGAISSSFLYGMCLQGWDPSALFYAIRLSLQCVSVVVVPCALWRYFSGDFLRICVFFYRSYVVALGLGLVMYICFPRSSSLWAFLADHAVSYRGDPHVGRFCSVYLDPNFYASIAPMPFLLSCFLYKKSKRSSYLWGALAFAFSILLSWSRSGIALFIAILCVYASKRIGRLAYTKKMLRVGILLLVGIVCIGVGYAEQIQMVWDRIENVGEDISALCRLHTWEYGISLWKEHPLLGIGIGYLFSYTQQDIGLSSLDSSLLSLLVQVGVVFFMVFVAILGRIAFFLHRLSRGKKEPHDPYFFPLWLWYGWGILLFASAWNNILFYSFWLFPFVTISSCAYQYLLRIGTADHRSHILANSNERLG